ncbi:MAG: hypothetical protein HYU66_22940 [Armatimonadetes bacterium]|nr:hypothetical protein [Armatimonadota bacterium]
MRRHRLVAAAAAVACAWLLLSGLRAWLRAVPPEQAVRQAITDFCEGIETRHIDRAGRIVSARFRGDGYTKGDIVRGLWQLNREYSEIHIYVADVQVYPSPDGRSADALVQVAITGQAGAREATLGQDHPVVVHSRFEKEGRRWRAVQADGIPVLDYGY